MYTPTNRFALFMDYQHRIRARSPFPQAFVVQLAAQPVKKDSYCLGHSSGKCPSFLYAQRMDRPEGQSLQGLRLLRADIFPWARGFLYNFTILK